MNDSIPYRAYLQEMMAQRRYAKIQYFTDIHELMTVHALIRTIQNELGMEWLMLSNGDTIGLPQLVSVGGRFAPDYDGYQLYCETCDC